MKLTETISVVSVGSKNFAMVPVEKMRVDREYQRVLRSRVKRMADAWDYEKCDVLIVSYRDGVFFLVDGQHRYEAAKANDVRFLACQILEGMSQEDEARRFLSQNTEACSLTPYDTWNANLLIGDFVDCTIDKICKEFGLKIRGTVGKRAPGVVGSLVEARNTVKSHGAEGLRWVFNVLSGAHWNEVRDGHNSCIMQALRQFYAANKETIFKYTDRAINTLFGTSPAKFQARAVAMFSDCDVRFAVSKYVAMQLVMPPSAVVVA